MILLKKNIRCICGNIFVKELWWNRRHCSKKCMFQDPVYRLKLSAGLKGKSKSEDHRNKISLSWTKERKEKQSLMLERNNPATRSEVKRKISKTIKDKFQNDEVYRNKMKASYVKGSERNSKISSFRKGKSIFEFISKKEWEHVVKKQQATRNYRFLTDPVYRDNIKRSEKCKQLISESWKRNYGNHCKSLSVARKKYFGTLSPEEYNQYCESFFQRCRRKPNGMERLLTTWLEDWYGELFRYVGDGQIFIAGKNPDFIGHGKLIIEFFGKYWHEPEDEMIRSEHFKKYGYETLIVWEHELKNPGVIKQRIDSFIGIRA